MEIRIASSRLNEIVDSISRYIFAEVREVKEKQNIEWLTKFTELHERMKKCDITREYVYIDVEGFVINDLAEMIGKHIFEDIQNMNDSQLMFEMMEIYIQLKNNGSTDIDSSANKEDASDKEDEETSAGSEIGENYDTEIRYNKKKKESNEEDSHYEDIKEEITMDDFIIMENDTCNENEEAADSDYDSESTEDSAYTQTWSYDEETEEEFV